MNAANFAQDLLIAVVVFLSAWLIIEKIRRENLREENIRLIAGHDKVKAKDYFLTQNEQAFFEELKREFGESYLIFSQVSLSALVEIKDNQLDRFERRNAISKFFVDFVLCDQRSTKTLLIIELNDKTHNLPNRKERDLYISKTIQAVGIKFYACEVNSSGYKSDMEKIRLRLVANT